MSIIKVGLPFSYFSMKKNIERFSWFLTYKNDFENQICATFDLKN